MIICVCHRVSDRDIAAAVRSGCDSFEALQAELKVATGCGRCGDCARDTLQRCSSAAQGAGVLPAVSAALASVPGRASMAARRVLMVQPVSGLPGAAA